MLYRGCTVPLAWKILPATEKHSTQCRHSDRAYPRFDPEEWRSPDHMDMGRSAVPGAWIPAIPAGMTVTWEVVGDRVEQAQPRIGYAYLLSAFIRTPIGGTSVGSMWTSSNVGPCRLQIASISRAARSCG